MKKILKEFVKTFSIIATVCLIVIVCMYHSSCKITPEGISLYDDGEKVPKITEYKIQDNVVSVSFSDTVSVESCFAVEAVKGNSSIETILDSENKLNVETITSENENEIQFRVTDNTVIGLDYELYSCVRDSSGNSLSFTIPFSGENKNFPKIIISEVNDLYSKKDELYEYVELYTLSSGNLFGLELVSAADGKTFPLPCVEVGEGEYIVVHLRRPEESELAVSELTSDFNESKGFGSVDGVRDIWVENGESVLNGTADIILLNNKSKTKLADCVLYCKKEYADENCNWKSEELQKAALRCVSEGLWEGDGKPSSAVYSEERKTISHISRKNVPQDTSGLTESGLENGRLYWTGTTKSKISPGTVNQW